MPKLVIRRAGDPLHDLRARERLQQRHENGALAHPVDLVERRLLPFRTNVRLA